MDLNVFEICAEPAAKLLALKLLASSTLLRSKSIIMPAIRSAKTGHVGMS